MKKEAQTEGKKVKKLNSKLRNKVIFGNSIENPKKKVVVKIINTKKTLHKKSFAITFKKEKQLSKALIAIKKSLE